MPRMRPKPSGVLEAVLTRRPAEPLHCLRPAVFAEAARRFVAGFPGEVLYAVKCNPQEAVLKALRSGGIRRFDAASLPEVQLINRLFPHDSVHFMHPVKPRSAIRAAFHQHGVRDFALDSTEELAKILAETQAAGGLGLLVRLALPAGGAARWDLSGKFGAQPAQAAALLRAARPAARRLGLCFHVGSQCLDPAAYESALALAGMVIEQAGVPVEVVDVGGGFPVSYPDVVPPPLGDYIAAVARGAGHLPPGVRLWCEPGRALVAPGESLVVQVLLRRGDSLYVNDGIYGALSDAGPPSFRFPARLLRREPSCAALRGFALYGPTCDSADRMNGPFLLPADIAEGDWIEIGQIGAYGRALRTGFNGFDRFVTLEVRDRPLLETPGYAEEAAEKVA